MKNNDLQLGVIGSGRSGVERLLRRLLHPAQTRRK
jgi:hypothetical protein